MRVSLCLSILAMAAFAAGCATPAPPPTLPATLDAATLPPAARAALNTQWPHQGWQLATITPADISCPAAAKASNVIVTSDLDSDNLPDIALEVTTPHGVRLVALMARDDGYHLFDLDGLGDRAASAGLVIEKRGDRYVSQATTFEDYFSQDTVATVSCGQGTTSYFWNGLGFSKTALAASPAPTGGGSLRPSSARR